MNKSAHRLLLTLLMAMMTSSVVSSLSAEDFSFKGSIDVDFMASYAYKNSLGLDTTSAKLAYSPILSYSFLLNEYNSLGITLIKFEHFAWADNPLSTFAYGFNFKHYWHRDWADLGVFVPWISYGILLNQAIVSNRSGRAIGHNTRVALGTDLVLAPSHRLVLQVAWDSVDYPAFDSPSSNNLGSISVGLGYRLLF